MEYYVYATMIYFFITGAFFWRRLSNPNGRPDYHYIEPWRDIMQIYISFVYLVSSLCALSLI